MNDSKTMIVILACPFLFFWATRCVITWVKLFDKENDVISKGVKYWLSMPHLYSCIFLLLSLVVINGLMFFTYRTYSNSDYGVSLGFGTYIEQIWNEETDGHDEEIEAKVSVETVDFFDIADSRFGKRVFEDSPYENADDLRIRMYNDDIKLLMHYEPREKSISVEVVMPRFRYVKERLGNMVYLFLSCGMIKLFN